MTALANVIIYNYKLKKYLSSITNERNFQYKDIPRKKIKTHLLLGE